MKDSFVFSVLTAFVAAAIISCSAVLNSGARAQSAQAAAASTPLTLSYQGVLKPAVGNLSAGTRLLTVTLYADANGNTTLWQSTMNTPIDSNGVFNLMLGSADNPLPSPSAMDRPIWLGVAIDNGPELRPFSQITVSAFAINVADNAITTAKLADNAVTASKLDADYVSSISVNGQKVTGKGSDLNIIGGNGVNLAYDNASNSLVLNTSGSTLNANGKGANVESPTTEWQIAGNSLGSGGVLGSLSTSANPNWKVLVGSQQVGMFQYVPTVTGIGDIVGGSSNNEIYETSDGLEHGGNFIGGGGDGNNDGNIIYYSHFGTIAGGLGNRINYEDQFDSQNVYKFQFVGGGEKNHALRKYSAVVGGDRNHAFAVGSTIGAGYYNLVDSEANWSVIAGGDTNRIEDTTSFIGGGYVNSITAGNMSAIAGGEWNSISSGNGAIGGGRYNLIYGTYGTIAGGDTNAINVSGEGGHSNYDAIGGGLKNTITNSDTSVIAGGTHNNITSAPAGFIGGGAYNTVESKYSVIAGGDTNEIHTSSDRSFIGGGDHNQSYQEGSMIGGGSTNYIGLATYGYSTIAGGTLNHIEEDYNGIGAGAGNIIFDPYETYDWYNYIGGGYYDTIRSSFSAVIAGGEKNVIDILSNYGTIGGGDENHVRSQSATIAGGSANNIPYGSDYSIIGGGQFNSSASNYGTIGGGDEDTILFSTDWSTIGGGLQNKIDTFSEWSFIGGGDSNLIERSTLFGKNNHQAYWATIAGGRHNTALDYGTFVGGGSYNIAGEEESAVVCGLLDTVLSSQSTIAGGYRNRIGINEIDRLGDSASDQSFIGAGFTNRIDASRSAIGAGDSLRIDSFSSYSFMGAGQFNRIHSSYQNSVIVGGNSNSISITNSHPGRSDFIGAGDSNLIDGFGEKLGGNPAVASAIVAGLNDTVHESLSFIGAGKINRISDDADFIGAGTFNLENEGSENAIVAGRHNSIDVNEAFRDGIGSSFIGAGDSNDVEEALAFIGAGAQNTIDSVGLMSFIGAGDTNMVKNERAFIGGGEDNTITGSGTEAFIGAGLADTNEGHFGVIGGGRGNFITTAAPNADIPGGDSLIANSYAQTVVGHDNIKTGVVTKATPHALNDSLLFIVGNGDDATLAKRSDAFAVTIGGGAMVTENRGTGGAVTFPTPSGIHSIYGTSYQDNVIVAWANVPAGSLTPSPTTVVNTISDFGVASIINPNFGVYNVTLNVIDPATGIQRVFTGGSVVATLIANAVADCPLTISTTALTGNTFTVFIVDNSCTGVNKPFTFQVVGR